MINGKFYIGQHRTKYLKDGYLGSGNVLKRAIDKYGRENFKRIILEYCSSAKELDEAEKRWVTMELVNDHNCYNMKTGGEQYCEWGRKSREKLSIAKTGTKLTEETKKKLRIIATEKNPFKGKHHTDDTKSILRERCANFGDKNGFYGKKHSQQTKNKISQRKIGTKRTQSSKEKQSVAITGEKNHFYGKRHTEETKNKIREKRTKYKDDLLHIVIKMREFGKTWTSICDELNINSKDSLRKAVSRRIK